MTIDVIKELKAIAERPGMNQTILSRMLDLSGTTISKLVNDQQPVTVNVAARLSAAGVGTVEEILKYQYEKDCRQAKKMRVNVKKDCLK